MFPFILEIVVAAALAQAAPANTACATLTPAQVTSLIGTATTLPMSSAAGGATCMFQNNDKMVTVLVANVASVDGAKGLFSSKKAVVAGADIQGWGVPAYSGSIKDTAAVGVLKQQTFTEVKVIDKTQKPGELVAKLQAVMKEFAGRK